MHSHASSISIDELFQDKTKLVHPWSEETSPPLCSPHLGVCWSCFGSIANTVFENIVDSTKIEASPCHIPKIGKAACACVFTSPLGFSLLYTTTLTSVNGSVLHRQSGWSVHGSEMVLISLWCVHILFLSYTLLPHTGLTQRPLLLYLQSDFVACL